MEWVLSINILRLAGFFMNAEFHRLCSVLFMALSDILSLNFGCRKYVPELKRLPLKYLFEPWRAPLKVQKAARCVVGDDYPEPVANHSEQRKICVRRLKDLCISLDIFGTYSSIVQNYLRCIQIVCIHSNSSRGFFPS